jgi:hypothetical protein
MVPQRVPLLPLLALAAAGSAALLFRIETPQSMFTDMDLLLRGGGSFALVLGGNYAFWRRTGRDVGWTVLALALLFGVAVEVGQFYLRIDFAAGDLVADALGALGGWAMWCLVRPSLRRGRT